MSFWNTVSKQIRSFRSIHERILNNRNASNELRALDQAIVRNRGLMIRASMDMSTVNSRMLFEANKELRTAMNRYKSYIKAHFGTIGEAEAHFAVEVMQETKDFLDHTSTALVECVNTINSESGGPKNIDMGTIKEQGRQVVMETEPGDIDNEHKEKTFAQLLWLGENEALANRTGQERQFAASQMGVRLTRLIRAIERSPLKDQAQYARLLAERERYLQRQVAAALAEARKRYEGRADQEQQAMETLVNDPYYREAVSFYALRDRLIEGPMEGIIRAASTRYVGATVEDADNLERLVKGEMLRRLQAAPSGADAQLRAGEKDQQTLRESGIPLDKFSMDLFDLGRRIAADPDKGASPFYAMAQQLMNLEREDHSKPNTALYTKRLRALEIASREYIRTHRAHPHTNKGKRRIDIANDVHRLVLERIEAIRNSQPHNQAEEERRATRERNAQLRINNNNGSKEDYHVISRLQANVGTARINPPAPARKDPADDLDALQSPGQRTLLHGLYTGFKFLTQITVGLPTNLVGLGMKIMRKFSKPKNPAPRNYDSEHVPGLPGEKYVEPEGDKIITDKRRIPLVFEHPIPEDANQPITLTFEVEQPVEGSAVSNVGLASRVGHTFLTLKYSKINPATGKMQRYQSSFGFYPANDTGFRTLKAMSTGGAVDGQLADDFEHTVSVGSTVEITPKQFNDIIRFAGQYEKGGYNMVSRNCTTFALDAISHAKVKIPEIEGIKQVDFTGLEPLGVAIGTADVLIGTLLTHEIAKNQVQNLAAQKGDTYSRLGQNKASAEDVERTDEFTLNNRVRGYTPGETAEHMRANGAIDLHSKRYEGSKTTRTAALQRVLDQVPENEQQEIRNLEKDERMSRVKEKHGGLFYAAMMESEIARLKKALVEVYRSDEHAMTTVIPNFENFLRSAQKSTEMFVKDTLEKKEKTETTTENLKRACTQINDFIADMNKIYHESFHSDPRLNGPFQHMVSLAERIRHQYYAKYEKTLNLDELNFKSEPIASGDYTVTEKRAMYENECAVYDQNRAISSALYDADHYCTTVTVPSNKFPSGINVDLTAKKIMAMIFAFDDPMDAVTKILKEKNEEVTRAQRREYQSMDELLSVMDHAVEMLHDGHRFSEGELRHLFVDSRTALSKLGIFDTSILVPYYTMAVDGILGNGFFPELENMVREDILANRDKLEVPAQDEYAKLCKTLNDVKKEEATPEQLKLFERKKQLEDEFEVCKDKQIQYTEGLQRKVVDLFNQKLKALPENVKEQLRHLGDLSADGVEKLSQEASGNRDNRLTDADRKELSEAGLNDVLVKSYLHNRITKAVKSLLPGTGDRHRDDLLVRGYLGTDRCVLRTTAMDEWKSEVIQKPVAVQENQPVHRAPVKAGGNILA